MSEFKVGDKLLHVSTPSSLLNGSVQQVTITTGTIVSISRECGLEFPPTLEVEFPNGVLAYCCGLGSGQCGWYKTEDDFFNQRAELRLRQQLIDEIDEIDYKLLKLVAEALCVEVEPDSINVHRVFGEEASLGGAI